ncbi:MAG: Sec-independent protein translocase protein TatB [Acidibrevibacterium sp.]|jgi:sec-independent protein translocase protein TatB|uniref:Sec-independent protein translocase protein TatB n=1 Tax=Acidibrevibacterium fodinaquatile TaxID=1969806 RepID=UPI0023A842B5|nr:Sec-independent protein translocase protein TatB [Acidibrevibacterium fodinaquatile]MCA7119915.1 Sec-independent protein translocase protein TatB [Acidibrevibacterium fodinaquatile]
MFDFAWSEIALVGVVALIAIGPKDMPAAMRAVAGMVKKARRMAAEFQGHVDEMMREADLGEFRQQINEIRNFDVRGAFTSAVDPDGSLARNLNESPFESTPVAAHPETVIERPEDVAPGNSESPPAEAAPAPPEAAAAPSFIPPEIAAAPAPPAFIPPGVTRAHRRG